MAVNLHTSSITTVRLLSFEAVLSAAIVIGCICACVSQFSTITQKARLAEALMGLAVARIGSVERFAVTGELGPGPDMASDTVRSVTMQRSANSDAPTPAQNERFHYQSVGTSLVGKGMLPHQTLSVQLALNAAVSADETPWAMMWLCGAREPPAGWTTRGTPLSTQLPPELTFSVCR